VAYGCGGGVHAVSGAPLVAGNLIRDNSALLFGGGIHVGDQGLAELLENRVIENWSLAGGGLSVYHNACPSVIGNLIARNVAEEAGGGAIIYSPPLEFRGNTVAGNEALLFGGGIFCSYASPFINNTILWDNTPDEVYPYNSSPVLTYCDVEGGWPGQGNIDADPLFVFPAWDDCRLLWESPCIDSGDPVLNDPDSTRSDIGAFFFDQGDSITLYISPDGPDVAPAGKVGVIYTFINRRPAAREFWFASQAALPAGQSVRVLGPIWVHLPGQYTAQIFRSHAVPPSAPHGRYLYRAGIGFSPDEVIDEDSFRLRVRAPGQVIGPAVSGSRSYCGD